MAGSQNALAPIKEGKRHPGDIERSRPNPLMAGLMSAQPDAYPGLSAAANQRLRGQMHQPNGSVSPIPPPQMQPAAGSQTDPHPDHVLAMIAQHAQHAEYPAGELDRQIKMNAEAVHQLGPLVAKGVKVTHNDIVTQALTAVQAGTLTAVQAAAFIDKVKGTPSQMHDSLKKAVVHAMLANVGLAAVKQGMAGSPPPNASPQSPINQQRGN